MTSVRVPRHVTALLTLVGVGLCWLVGTSSAMAATGSPSSPASSISARQTLGRAGQGPSTNRIVRTSAATSTAVPTQQTPTNATNNQPGLITGAAVLSLVLIGGGALVARHRLTDDEHE
ncbi:hypothetical protein [Leekyejoonella antrihumi]|uniref:LPXTG cell wall anchor domain-containing protein n=1 Tax=Leekyejoonella antrihumi TaxID=1660198 RepID=A0A563E9L3_9MICO|nr:hypothetical protein [Leekyejoonella antrihumi]TWP38952.1 hypothetical protein FGL98_00715 [Leekyejoonella antrihumi]